MEEYKYKEVEILTNKLINNEISYEEYIKKFKSYKDEAENDEELLSNNAWSDLEELPLMQYLKNDANKYYNCYKKCKSNKNKIKRRKAKKYH